MISVDTYLQPDALDPVLEDDVVVEIGRRHAPAVSEVLEVDESGGEARAYLLDADVILKTQRPHRLRPRTSLAKEALILDQLGATSSLPVPRILGYGSVDSVEYILMSRMPGVAMYNIAVSPEARAAALRELGRILRQLHGVDQAVFADSELIPGDRDPADLRDRLAGALQRLTSALDGVDGWRAPLRPAEMVERTLGALPDTTPIVLLHSNPSEVHAFVDPTSGKFTGIIDFGDSYRSHPALDLRAWADRGDAAELRAGYAAAGPLSSAFDEIWRVGQVMTEMAVTVRGRRDPELAAQYIGGLLAE